MPDIFAKVPFIRLLLPMSAGIAVQYYYPVSRWCVVFLFAGLIMMLASYFIHPSKQYNRRWIFGLSLLSVLFCIGSLNTRMQQSHSSFNFSPEETEYKGIITSVPRYTEKSLACDVELSNGKNIICYFQKGVRSRMLEAGDEIILRAKIGRVKHFATPTGFDYPAYMYNKGISGSAYLFSEDWEATGVNRKPLQTLALECRRHVIDFYRTLGLDDNAFSVLSALTLGYKDTLNDDVVQSFRATGTAHILAVSGMHAGIIYGVLVGVFALFFRNVRYSRTAQSCIIICLWGYALVTGFSPSVVRACLMLSIFCAGNILRQNGFTYNNICIAAFFMLLYNPFWLFDIGFQLSFSAVIAIRFLQPYFSNMAGRQNRFVKSAWNLFSLSLVAQIGTLPLCLYYFGMFPTYFFITNLLIIPLVAVVVYAGLIVLLMGVVSQMPGFGFIEGLYHIPADVLNLLVGLMVEVLRFFENIPFAVIQNVNIPLPAVIFLFAGIVLFCAFIKYKKIRAMQMSLGITAVALVFCIIPPKNTLSIYQDREGFLLSWNINHNKYTIDSVSAYNYVRLGNKNLLSVSGDVWKDKQAETLFTIDYLHIVKSDSISLYSLTQRFFVKNIIIDGSLSGGKRKKLIKECKNLKIPYYDVSEKGLFRTNF